MDSNTGKIDQDDPVKLRLLNFVGRSRAYTLLLALIVQIILSSLNTEGSIWPLVYHSVVILAAVVVAADTRRHFLTGLALGFPSIVLSIVSHSHHSLGLNWINYVFIVVLYLYVIRLMLIKIFNTRTVTAETIGFAICTYLLIGTVFTIFYVPIVVYDDQAFSQPIIQSGSGPVSILTYFSFVTLTTLGYGDISPISPIARSVAILEALTGTLFLAVLISRLIGASTRRR